MESEESLFDSSEGEREVSQPSEMAGAGADPADGEMQDLFVLINEERREDGKALLNTIKKHWTSIEDQMSYLLPEDLISAHDENEYKDQMNAMKRLMAAAVTSIDEVAEKYHLEENDKGESIASRLTALKDPLVHKVRDYQKMLRVRMAFLKNQNPAAAGAGGGRGGPGFQIYQDPPANPQNPVITKAKVKCKAIQEDSGFLSDELTEIDILGWSLASDLEISRAMRKMKVWRDRLENVRKQWREVDEIIFTANIQDKPEEVTEAEEAVQSLQTLFQEVKKQVEGEDLSRCLHSLEISTTDTVSLPSFEGRDDEDWTIFRGKLEKALAANRVKTSDKCDKLRECLRGHARNLVPNTQEDFVAALNALEKAFGDSSTVLNVKIASLKEVGSLPKNTNNKSGKLVVEWYFKLEATLNSLLDLGCKTEDEDIKFRVFSKEIIMTVAGLFPEIHGVPIIQCGGTGERRLRKVLGLIGDLRGKALQWLLVHDKAGASPALFGMPSFFCWFGPSSPPGSVGDLQKGCNETWQKSRKKEPDIGHCNVRDLENECEQMSDYTISDATPDVLGLIASVNVDLDDEPPQQTQWSTAV